MSRVRAESGGVEDGGGGGAANGAEFSRSLLGRTILIYIYTHIMLVTYVFFFGKQRVPLQHEHYFRIICVNMCLVIGFRLVPAPDVVSSMGRQIEKEPARFPRKVLEVACGLETKPKQSGDELAIEATLLASIQSMPRIAAMPDLLSWQAFWVS